MYKKNTASQFFCFQGVDTTTGGIKTGVSWTVRRCIDGTFAAATGTVSEDGSTGWYKFAMSQADTNGNNISFNFTGTGAVPQTVNILTDGAPPDVNTAKVGGQTASASGTVTFPNATLASTTNITAASGVSLAADQAVNVTKVNGTTQTARDLGAQLDVAVSTRLAPTTAGRTLDVTTTGEAGIDWANIGSPTTSQTLSGTTIGTASAVTTVNGLAANVITATAINTGAITNTKFAAGAIDAAAIADNAIDAGSIATGAITNAKFAAGAIDAAAIATDAIGAAELAADAVQEIVNGVWDELLTGASHNIATSAGRRLRQLGGATAASINDAAATTTAFDTTLTAVDDFYNDQLILFTSGALSGQCKPILDYANTNGRITLDSSDPLTSAPANSVTFDILPNHIHPISQIGTGVWATSVRTVTAATNITSTGAAVPITAGGLVNADMAAISTDTTAADALETMLDGTGGNKLSLSQLNIVAAGNDSAIIATGAGSGSGIYAKSGTGATGDGLRLEGKSTTGFGIYASGNGGGAGATFVGGATGNGLEAYGGATGGHGISAAGQGEGDGMILTGIGGGNGLRIIGGDTDAHAVYIQTGYGATGDGIFIECQSTLGNGINMIASGNGSGFIAYGAGTGYGAHFQGGATNGSGIYAVGAGTGAGINTIGGATGAGMRASGGATGSSGILALGTGNSNGITAQGNNAGSGIYAIGGDGGNGVTILSSTDATGDGLYIASQATNGNGVNIVGAGTGAGVLITGGGTGNGLEAVGGATSGNGASIYAQTSGNGMLVAGAGAGVGITGDIGALTADMYALPGQEAPGASQTLVKMVSYLYKAFRNKIEQTSSTMSLYDDAGTTVDQKATVSDNGTTFTRGEIGSGP